MPVQTLRRRSAKYTYVRCLLDLNNNHSLQGVPIPIAGRPN
jgi:hypothetical protein